MCACCVSGSVDMIGHPDLQPECEVKQLEPLLPEKVVNDLLGKYLKTFNVSLSIQNKCPSISQPSKDSYYTFALSASFSA